MLVLRRGVACCGNVMQTAGLLGEVVYIRVVQCKVNWMGHFIKATTLNITVRAFNELVPQNRAKREPAVGWL